MPMTMEEKLKSLVQPVGGDRPAVPSSRTPVRSVVPTHSREQLQHFVAREAAKAEAARAAALEKQQAATQQPEPEEPKKDEPTEHGGVDKPEASRIPSEVSSYDAEVLEMCAALDPSELILHGEIVRELEIMDKVLTVTVKSLKKADITEIQRDVDVFRRGLPDPEDKDGRIFPSVESITDYSILRRMAAGVVGINGRPLAANSWEDRARELESLSDTVYSAIVRDYRKFLAAVSLLFPDKASKEQIDRLKEAVGKAKAHR